MVYSLYGTTDAHESGGTEKCPVMIMHGLLGSKSNWNSVSKSIQSRNKQKVITVDARNHGESPHTQEFNYPSVAEDIRSLMTDLKILKINAVGHSLGGRAMMYLALEYPHLINSLIVVDMSPVRTPSIVYDMSSLLEFMASIKLENNIPLSRGRKMVDEQLKERIPVRTLDFCVGTPIFSGITLSTGPCNMMIPCDRLQKFQLLWYSGCAEMRVFKLQDVVMRQFLLTNLVETDGQCKWRINLDSLISNFSSITNFEPPPNKKYEGPVLFIAGGKSVFLKKEDHEGILNYFPKAEFQYIPNAGHWVHAEKQAEFLDLVCNFLNRV